MRWTYNIWFIRIFCINKSKPGTRNSVKYFTLLGTQSNLYLFQLNNPFTHHKVQTAWHIKSSSVTWRLSITRKKFNCSCKGACATLLLLDFFVSPFQSSIYNPSLHTFISMKKSHIIRLQLQSIFILNVPNRTINKA